MNTNTFISNALPQIPPILISTSIFVNPSLTIRNLAPIIISIVTCLITLYVITFPTMLVTFATPQTLHSHFHNPLPFPPLASWAHRPLPPSFL